MKIFVVLMTILGLALSHVGKELSFDDELQKLGLTSFRTLLVEAKLFDLLNDPANSHTVFAPTNSVLEKVPSELLKNITRLHEILSYHVHQGTLETDKIKKDMVLKTLLGGRKKIRFEIYFGVLYGSCKPFGKTVDETYNNGVLDTFNGLMIPPEGDILDILSQSKSFTTFQSYLSKADLKEFFHELSKTTFLGPNDAAFKKLPPDVKDKLDEDVHFLRNVLKYHLVTSIYCTVGFMNGQVLETNLPGPTITVQVSSGGKVLFNNASALIQNDTIAYNGVFHTIDTVLLPP